MKILCLCTRMNHAGAQRALIRVAKGLSARGHEVSVRFFYWEGDTDCGDLDAKVYEHRVSPGTAGYIRVFRALYKELKQTPQPDAVLSFLPVANFAGQTLAAMAGIKKRIASQRGPRFTYGKVQQIMDALAGSAGMYSTNIAVSGTTKDSFVSAGKRYMKSMRVVYNGIDWAPSSLEKSAARAHMKLPKNVAIATCVGRLEPQKNYPFLLEAIARAPSFHLAVAGDGYLRPNLEAQVTQLGLTDRVHLLGAVKPSDIPHLLKATDVYVQPSLYEGQSNSTLEAMCAGLPVFVSDIPPQVETLTFIDGRVAGRLLPLTKPQSWAAALEMILIDTAAREALSQLSKERVSTFTVEKQITEFERIITQQ